MTDWERDFDNPKINSERALWRLCRKAIKTVTIAASLGGTTITAYYFSGESVTVTVAISVTEIIAIIFTELSKKKRKPCVKVSGDWRH